MSRTKIAAILAAAGIIFHGVSSQDAVALASAIKRGDQDSLRKFVQSHPSSPYVADVIISLSKDKSLSQSVESDCVDDGTPSRTGWPDRGSADCAGYRG